MYLLLLPLRLIRRTLGLLYNYEQLHKTQVIGNNCSFGWGLHIWNEGEMRLGNNLEGGRFIELTTECGGALEIGDNCFIGNNCKIDTGVSSIGIGDNCLIAEQVSIRSTNHGITVGTNMRDQRNTVMPIEIADDVWIGRGVAVLSGARIPHGCIIGANSVVLKKSKLETNCVYAGCPVKKIGSRKP